MIVTMSVLVPLHVLPSVCEW